MTLNDIPQKSLTDINKSYIKDIIDFFVREYSIMYLKNKQFDRLKEAIERQIENRLLKTKLIKDFRVLINVTPLQERRDNKISSIIQNTDLLENDNITVLISHIDHEITETKYYL
jgi:hypothetical protein